MGGIFTSTYLGRSIIGRTRALAVRSEGRFASVANLTGLEVKRYLGVKINKIFPNVARLNIALSAPKEGVNLNISQELGWPNNSILPKGTTLFFSARADQLTRNNPLVPETRGTSSITIHPDWTLSSAEFHSWSSFNCRYIDENGNPVIGKFPIYPGLRIDFMKDSTYGRYFVDMNPYKANKYSDLSFESLVAEGLLPPDFARNVFANKGYIQW